MLEKAIVPLDGSSTAEVALPYAEEFTGRTGAELILLFVKELHDYRSENILQIYLQSTAEKAKGAAKIYFPESKITELKVRTQILTGDPAEEILKFAESNPNSKIIMATHGQSGVGTRWALGSVADKVSRAAAIPMVLIRAERDKAAVHPKGILKQILAPLDGSKGSESSLPLVEEMALRLKAQVTFLQLSMSYLTVYGKRDELATNKERVAAEGYLKKITEDFQKKGIDARYEYKVGADEIGREINRYTRDNYTDIVIMATHGRSGPRRWVIGSVTNQVLREGNTPIMLVRTPGPFKD
jgi:nucleotide-binding universal stress UspA family protein